MKPQETDSSQFPKCSIMDAVTTVCCHQACPHCTRFFSKARLSHRPGGSQIYSNPYASATTMLEVRQIPTFPRRLLKFYLFTLQTLLHLSLHFADFIFVLFLLNSRV